MTPTATNTRVVLMGVDNVDDSNEKDLLSNTSGENT